MLHFQKLHFQSEPTLAFSTSNRNKAGQLNVIIKRIAKIFIITQLKEILKNFDLETNFKNTRPRLHCFKIQTTSTSSKSKPPTIGLKIFTTSAYLALSL